LKETIFPKTEEELFQWIKDLENGYPSGGIGVYWELGRIYFLLDHDAFFDIDCNLVKTWCTEEAIFPSEYVNFYRTFKLNQLHTLISGKYPVPWDVVWPRTYRLNQSNQLVWAYKESSNFNDFTSRLSTI